MPDLASIQQQMQQNPEVMSQIQMLSMSTMNSADFLRTMRIQSPYASGDGIQSRSPMSGAAVSGAAAMGRPVATGPRRRRIRPCRTRGERPPHRRLPHQ